MGCGVGSSGRRFPVEGAVCPVGGCRAVGSGLWGGVPELGAEVGVSLEGGPAIVVDKGDSTSVDVIHC